MMSKVFPRIAAIAMVLVAYPLAAAEPGEPADCQGKALGTSVTWYQNDDAARMARGQQKLLFVIQVSGNFAREEFT